MGTLRNRRRWSESEVGFLRRQHAAMTYREIGQHLDRSLASVTLKVQAVGLKTDRRGNGASSWPRPIWQRKKSGGCFWVRDSHGGWMREHVAAFIQRFGPVPEGHRVFYRDGGFVSLSPADIMRRHNGSAWPAPIRRAARLLGKLKRAAQRRQQRMDRGVIE